MRFNIGSLTPKVGPGPSMVDENEKAGTHDAGNESAEQLPHGLSAPHSLHSGGTAKKTALHMVKKGSVVVPPQHIKKVFGKNIGSPINGLKSPAIPGHQNQLISHNKQSFYGD